MGMSDRVIEQSTQASGTKAHNKCLALLLVSTAMTSGWINGTWAQGAGERTPSTQGVRAATYNFSIPPQSLASAVAAFSKVTGLDVIGDGGIRRGLRSPGVSGNMTAQQALGRLFGGTGLSYAFTNASTIAIQQPANAAAVGNVPADAIPLETIDVQGQGAGGLQADGTARDGYRARTVSAIGPLGPMALKDTPFTINVAPRELIQNIQAQSPDDVFKVLPNIRTGTPQLSGWAPVANIRGFTTYDTAEDGFRRGFSHATNIEDKERIEVLNGLSGFLYGAASPAGMINYVYKRPTFERLNSLTVGNYGGSQYYVHGDFGGRIDQEGRAGYRLNIVRQDGNTSINDQRIDRTLISAAFDWQLTDRLKLELNASHMRNTTENPSTYWAFVDTPHNFVPNTRKNWGQKWIRDEIEKNRLSAKLTYDLNDNITLRGGYMREYGDRPRQDHIMNLVDSPGQYSQIAIHSGRTKTLDEAAHVMADVKFNTGPIEHKLSFGYYMNASKAWGTTYSPNTGWLGPFSLAAPTYLPTPVFIPDQSSPYYQSLTRNHNFFIGDQIQFNEQWSALVGVNYSRIESTSLDSTGLKTQPDYNKGRASPSASLMFKALPWMTLYGSYIEGLEQGGVAPDTASNYGAVMAPMVSKQKEVGVKAEVGGLLLTGALFEIEKAYEFTNSSGVYTQSGRQNHRGVEFTATGKLFDSLTIMSGLTFLDAKVKGGDYNGLAPMNVAKVLAKIYAEYEIPTMRGLFLTGGVYHTGRQWANDLNTDRLPAYTTLDLGARYSTEAFGNPLTLRLNVTNVTGKNYWQNAYYLGMPRTIAFSAQMKF